MEVEIVIKKYYMEILPGTGGRKFTPTLTHTGGTIKQTKESRQHKPVWLITDLRVINMSSKGLRARAAEVLTPN